MAKLIERWESRSGKWWVELHQDDRGIYSYRANGAGGILGSSCDRFRRKLEQGYFQPDDNVTPMTQVFPS